MLYALVIAFFVLGGLRVHLIMKLESDWEKVKTTKFYGKFEKVMGDLMGYSPSFSMAKFPSHSPKNYIP